MFKDFLVFNLSIWKTRNVQMICNAIAEEQKAKDLCRLSWERSDGTVYVNAVRIEMLLSEKLLFACREHLQSMSKQIAF